MSQTENNSYHVRECRGHFHVCCGDFDLCLLPHSVDGMYRTRELAQEDCDLLNAGALDSGTRSSDTVMPGGVSDEPQK